MIDIKFLRENPEIVRQNIRNKFQESKLPLVDEVIAGFRAIGLPVIRADSRCGSRQLITNVAHLHANGNLPQQLQDHD